MEVTATVDVTIKLKGPEALGVISALEWVLAQRIGSNMLANTSHGSALADLHVAVKNAVGKAGVR